MHTKIHKTLKQGNCTPRIPQNLISGYALNSEINQITLKRHLNFKLENVCI